MFFQYLTRRPLCTAILFSQSSQFGGTLIRSLERLLVGYSIDVSHVPKHIAYKQIGSSMLRIRKQGSVFGI